MFVRFEAKVIVGSNQSHRRYYCGLPLTCTSEPRLEDTFVVKRRDNFASYLLGNCLRLAVCAGLDLRHQRRGKLFHSAIHDRTKRCKRLE